MINVNHLVRMFCLFLFTVVGYGFYNAYLPITDPVESNYVLSAVTMLKHNSWISPMIYDNVWYDKPPLTYWVLMITYKLFGISDFTSRIPNTLIAGISVSFIYHIVYRIKQSIPIAITSAILLMSTLQFWYISHAVITDGFLFFFSLATFGYAYLALEYHDRSAMVKAYAATGFAIITKGPIGLLLPGLILLLFTFVKALQSKDNKCKALLQEWRILFNPLGILVCLLIASPWYIAMYNIHGIDFILGFLGLHNVDRALVSEHPKFNVWYYYLIIVPIALLPWTPLLISKLRKLDWHHNFNQLSALWFFIIILFYSLVATKYLTYTLLAIIPCIIWTGEQLVSVLHNRFSDRKNSFAFIKLVLTPYIIFNLIFLIATFFDSSLTPTPLIISSILCLGSCIIITRRKTITKSTIMYLILPILCIYSAITITVPPILTSQSGIQFKPYLQKDIPTYIYGTYYTSLVYYTDTMPTQVFVDTKDDPRWTKGKNLMPTITKQELLNNSKNLNKAIVIVPNKYDRDFITTEIYQQSKKIGQTKSGKIYQLH